METGFLPSDQNSGENQLPTPPPEIPAPSCEEVKETPPDEQDKFELKMSVHLHNDLTQEQLAEIYGRKKKALRNIENEILRMLDAYELTGLVNLEKLELYKTSAVELPTDIYDNPDADDSVEIRSAIKHFRQNAQRVVAASFMIRRETNKKVTILNSSPFATVVIENEDTDRAEMVLSSHLAEVTEMVEKAHEIELERCKKEDEILKPLRSFDIIFRHRPSTFLRIARSNKDDKWEIFGNGRYYSAELKLIWPNSLSDIRDEVEEKKVIQKDVLDEYKFTGFVLKIKMTTDRMNEKVDVADGLKTFFKTLKTQFDLRITESGAVFDISLPSEFFSNYDAFTQLTDAAHAVMPGCFIQYILSGPNGVTFFNTHDVEEVRVSKGASRPAQDIHGDY